MPWSNRFHGFVEEIEGEDWRFEPLAKDRDIGPKIPVFFSRGPILIDQKHDCFFHRFEPV